MGSAGDNGIKRRLLEPRLTQAPVDGHGDFALGHPGAHAWKEPFRHIREAPCRFTEDAQLVLILADARTLDDPGRQFELWLAFTRQPVMA